MSNLILNVEYNEESNEKDPKFKVGDHVKNSKYKNIFAKGNAPNWSEEVFVISTNECSSIEEIDKFGEYGKDYMKIKFNSDDNLALNKLLKLHMLTIIVSSVVKEDGKYYPQIF